MQATSSKQTNRLATPHSCYLRTSYSREVSTEQHRPMMYNTSPTLYSNVTSDTQIRVCNYHIPGTQTALNGIGNSEACQTLFPVGCSIVGLQLLKLTSSLICRKIFYSLPTYLCQVANIIQHQRRLSMHLGSCILICYVATLWLNETFKLKMLSA